MKDEARAERDKREEGGVGDRWEIRQSLIPPELDQSLIGFHIEMVFIHVNKDGTTTPHQYSGVVTDVLNTETRCVKITWDERTLNVNDPKVTNEKLLESKWNPNTAVKGGWRQYFCE